MYEKNTESARGTGRSRRKLLFRHLLRRIVHLEYGDFWAAQGAFQRSNTYLLAYAILGMLLLAIGANILEQNTHLIAALSIWSALPLIVLFWLRKSPQASSAPTFLLVASLMLLGAWLLLGNTTDSLSGSVTWFILFPTMTMFSLGLRLGSLVFGLYYLFLLLLMLTPLSRYITMPLEESMRIRMLLAMLGAFVFSWWAEFIRENTRRALARSMERLEEEARTDVLTGLGNRRDFDAAFAWITAKFRRDMQPFSLAIIDLDWFKRINDTFGHAVGDKVLLHVSQVISRHIRASDRLFRWGGEEFTILMPGVGPEAAAAAAERIREAVAESPFMYEHVEISCTISVGLYSGTTTQDTDEALAIADKNLYAAKDSGRNRVVS
ncbi:GGDEF domain-containing protein [Desulfovibrio sp. OttesenSCG-928-I05]|nr:GGDEF domain-containing protein [Desulfovibrio sp. OttesenSCG-928-I05]